MMNVNESEHWSEIVIVLVYASVMSQDRSLHQSSQFWEWFVKQAFTQNVQIRENNKANTSFWSSRASKSVLYAAG